MATLSHFSHNIANKHIRRCMATLSSSWSTCCYKCSSASTTGQASRTENFAENMGCYMRLVVQNSFNHRGSLVAHSIPLCPVNFSVGKRRKRALAYENDKQSALGFVLCSTANTTRQMSRRLHTFDNSALLYRTQAITKNIWRLTPSRFVRSICTLESNTRRLMASKNNKQSGPPLS